MNRTEDEKKILKEADAIWKATYQRVRNQRRNRNAPEDLDPSRDAFLAKMQFLEAHGCSHLARPKEHLKHYMIGEQLEIPGWDWSQPGTLAP